MVLFGQRVLFSTASLSALLFHSILVDKIKHSHVIKPTHHSRYDVYVQTAGHIIIIQYV